MKARHHIWIVCAYVKPSHHFAQAEPFRCCPFDRRIDLSTVLDTDKGSTREPQCVLNRLKDRQAIVDSKNPVPVQHRWSIHVCTPLAMDCPLLNDGFHQSRNRFRQSDRHAAGRDSIPPALPSDLCQRGLLSAARNDGRAERPRRIIVLRARRERNSSTFIVDKGTPNLCAASLAGSPSRSQSSMAVRRGPGSFNSASERIFRCSTRAHCSSGLGSSEGGSIPGATNSSPVNVGSSENSRRHFRLRNRIRDELMAFWRPHCPPHRSSIS